MNLKDLTAVADQPGLFVHKSGEQIRLQAPDGTPFVLPLPKKDEGTPPATPAPAAPAAPAPAPAATSTPAPAPSPATPSTPAPTVDAFTAARQRLEPKPIVPAEKPTTEALAKMDPWRQARSRLVHNMYGQPK